MCRGPASDQPEFIVSRAPASGATPSSFRPYGSTASATVPAPFNLPSWRGQSAVATSQRRARSASRAG